MNKAVQLLTKEHEVIRIAIAKTLALFSSGTSDNTHSEELKMRLDFFKNYADQYHHKKEEQVLFPEMIKRNEMLEFGVVHEMLENHEDFREMILEIETLIDEEDLVSAQKEFQSYSEKLLEHMAVEDDEVFQIAETLISEDELLTIYYRFQDCDRELGELQKMQLEQEA